MTLLFLDTNLMLLLLIGNVAPQWIGRHKRLTAYDRGHYDRLVSELRGVEMLVATPNVLTEVSNLATQGVKEPLRSQLIDGLAKLVGEVDERYLASQHVVKESEFSWLGLADVAALLAIDNDTIFLTDDGQLFGAAIDRGHSAYHFRSTFPSPRHRS